MFEILGEDQRRILLEHGISPERIWLKRDSSPVVFSGRENPLEHPKELNGVAVLLYSGNYGVPHHADTVVEGIHRAGVAELREGLMPSALMRIRSRLVTGCRGYLASAARQFLSIDSQPCCSPPMLT